MAFDHDGTSVPMDVCNDFPLSLNWSGIERHLLRELGLDGQKNLQAYDGMVSCLLLAGRINMWVHYSRRRDDYTGLSRYYGPYFTYRNVVKMVDVLCALDLIEEDRQRPGRYGAQSRMKCSSRLSGIASGWTSFKQRPLEVVRLKDCEKRLVGYADTKLTTQMRARIQKHNQAIAGLCISSSAFDCFSPALCLAQRPILPSSRQLYRVFNGDWFLGGRLYGGFWQNLPADLRTTLLIDGEETCELDYKCLHPQLLYHAFGRPMPFDAYAIDGVDRTLCKIAFQILLNSRSKQVSHQALAHHLLGEKIEVDEKSARLKAKMMLRRLTTSHRGIELAFSKGVGLRLQKIDSELILRVMDRCLLHDIVGLPVHDSLIIKVRHKQMAEAIMQEELNRMSAELQFMGFQGLVHPKKGGL